MRGIPYNPPVIRPPLRERSLGSRLVSLAVALGLVASLPAVADEATWRLLEATTSIGFEPGLLEMTGLRLEDVHTTVEPFVPHGRFLRFASVPGDTLELRRPEGIFRGAGAGALRHRGGFTLVSTTGRRIDVHGFVIAAAADENYLFELRSASGEPLFRSSHTHHFFDHGMNAALFVNADLHLTAELAESLGQPKWADLPIGQLDLRSGLDDAGTESVATCPANLAQPNDVETTAISGMSQWAREAGVRVAVAGSASLTNHGPGDVEWKEAIEPDVYAPLVGPGPHPMLSQALYRLGEDGALQMVGQADVKHAFYSVNSNCTCNGDHILYAGCGDTYSASNNSDRQWLAPRSEVTAHGASWTSLGSHFDVYPEETEDDIRSHSGPAHDSFEHRLVVAESDLESVGARYFLEIWYVVANDANPWNNVAWREFDPTFISEPSSGWTFSSVGSTTSGPAIDEWVDPASPGDHEASSLVDTGAGRFKLASRATEVEGGWRYDYALLNFDFDRRISAFSVPVGASSGASDPVFRGAGLAAPPAPWPSTLDTTTVHWDAGAGDALDWGTLFGFAFTSPYPPKRALATVDAFEAGSPGDYQAQVVAPAELIFADGFESGGTSAWTVE